MLRTCELTTKTVWQPCSLRRHKGLSVGCGNSIARQSAIAMSAADVRSAATCGLSWTWRELCWLATCKARRQDSGSDHEQMTPPITDPGTCMGLIKDEQDSGSETCVTTLDNGNEPSASGLDPGKQNRYVSPFTLPCVRLSTDRWLLWGKWKAMAFPEVTLLGFRFCVNHSFSWIHLNYHWNFS